MTWVELCNDKNLRDLPYKIELNRAGKLIMSPTRNLHGYLASQIAHTLKNLLPSGETITECAIETEDSTKVANVARASEKTFAIIKNEFSCSVAPEICVGVLSPSNAQAEIEFKRELYLKAEAQEYWVCDEAGAVQFFNASGPLDHSILCPSFPRQLEE